VTVSSREVLANVDWSIEEARRQIDQQMTTAAEIDGRATALLGVIGGVTGIIGVFSDLNLTTPERVAATALVVLFGVGSTVFLAWSIVPIGGASYGAGVEGAVFMADELDTLTFKRSQARSLRDAMRDNRVYLTMRQRRLKAGTVLFALAVLAILAMLVTGAFSPVPKQP